jgi:hypothetical protein
MVAVHDRTIILLETSSTSPRTESVSASPTATLSWLTVPSAWTKVATDRQRVIDVRSVTDRSAVVPARAKKRP